MHVWERETEYASSELFAEFYCTRKSVIILQADNLYFKKCSFVGDFITFKSNSWVNVIINKLFENKWFWCCKLCVIIVSRELSCLKQWTTLLLWLSTYFGNTFYVTTHFFSLHILREQLGSFSSYSPRVNRSRSVTESVDSENGKLAKKSETKRNPWLPPFLSPIDFCHGAAILSQEI